MPDTFHSHYVTNGANFEDQSWLGCHLRAHHGVDTTDVPNLRTAHEKLHPEVEWPIQPALTFGEAILRRLVSQDLVRFVGEATGMVLENTPMRGQVHLSDPEAAWLGEVLALAPEKSVVVPARPIERKHPVRGPHEFPLGTVVRAIRVGTTERYPWKRTSAAYGRAHFATPPSAEWEAIEDNPGEWCYTSDLDDIVVQSPPGITQGEVETLDYPQATGFPALSVRLDPTVPPDVIRFHLPNGATVSVTTERA